MKKQTVAQEDQTIHFFFKRNTFTIICSHLEVEGSFLKKAAHVSQRVALGAGSPDGVLMARNLSDFSSQVSSH